MKTRIITLLASALAVFVLSTAAFASDSAVRAESRGPGEGDGGGGGVGGCFFAYSIQKIGQTLANEGESMTYHLVVSNIGNCRLRRIDVTDTLPRGVEFVAANPAPSWVDDRRLRWDDVELKAGRYVDFEIEVKVDKHLPDGKCLTNTGCAFSRAVGTRICDSVTTTVVDHHHPAD